MKQHYHLRTVIVKLIVGSLFFFMRSCEYSTTSKGDHKLTHILWKGDIKLYIKRCKLTHIRGCIHLEDKVSATFWTQEIGFKNATVTQWWTGKHLWLVQIWVDIITRP